MRGRRHLVLFASLVLGPGYLACQLVDPASDLDGEGSGDGGVLRPDGSVGDTSPPRDAISDAAPGDSAAPFCLGQDATVCDGFDQDDGPVNALGAPFLAKPSCDTGSITVIGGRLSIEHPVNDGTRFSTCVLQADPPGATGQFTLAFDFSYQLPDGYADAQVPQLAVISSVAVSLGSPDDAGLEDIDFQLLLGASGQAQYLAIPHYPDASKSPPPHTDRNYPTYHLAELDYPQQWLPPATSCHIVVTGNTVAVTGAAMATCNGHLMPLPARVDPPPPGIAAPAVLSLGYTESVDQGTWPDWKISYDDLLFTTGP